MTAPVSLERANAAAWARTAQRAELKVCAKLNPPTPSSCTVLLTTTLQLSLALHERLHLRLQVHLAHPAERFVRES